MQLTIEVKGGDFVPRLEELLASLNAEERKALAREVFLKILHEDPGIERQAKEEEVLRNMRSRYPDKSDAALREDYNFKETMRTWKSQREVLVTGIFAESLKLFKEKVEELVANDPRTQGLLIEAQEQFVANLPKYAEHAMVSFFVATLSSISGLITSASMQSVGLNVLKDNLKNVLSQAGFQNINL